MIDFTKLCNKNEVVLYCRKYDPYFPCQDESKFNPDKLPSLIVSDGYLYVEEKV